MVEKVTIVKNDLEETVKSLPLLVKDENIPSALYEISRNLRILTASLDKIFISLGLIALNLVIIILFLAVLDK